MALPFAARATPFAVHVGDRRWWANCAWDAYAIPAALGAEDAVIDTECPDCGEVMRLEVRAGEARGADALDPLLGTGVQMVGRHRLHLTHHPGLPVGRTCSDLVRRGGRRAGGDAGPRHRAASARLQRVIGVGQAQTLGGSQKLTGLGAWIRVGALAVRDAGRAGWSGSTLVGFAWGGHVKSPGIDGCAVGMCTVVIRRRSLPRLTGYPNPEKCKQMNRANEMLLWRSQIVIAAFRARKTLTARRLRGRRRCEISHRTR